MFELKKGMKFIDEEGTEQTVLELGKSSTGETTYVYERDSFGGTYAYFSEGIDWEETAKLNGIDLMDKITDKIILKKLLTVKEYKMLVNEVEKQSNKPLSIADLKQKKEELKQNIYDLLQKFEEETTVKVKKMEMIEHIPKKTGMLETELYYKELLIELEV